MIFSSRRLHFYLLITLALIILLLPLLSASIKNTDSPAAVQLAITEQTNHQLTFSQTQTWDPEYGQYLSPSRETLKAAARIVIPPPPKNDSEETKNELNALHLLTKLRQPQVVAEIESEIDINNIAIGSWNFRETRETHPNTFKLLSYANDQVVPIIIHFKSVFDRVRPSLLDPTLTTAIEVPGHPAYPSGHASQSYTFAHILSELDPEHTKAYFDGAYKVAHNREIAGVHYPSDSEAGRILAEQFITILEEDPIYEILLKEARAEW